MRDRYGDYGYCGFYAIVTGARWARLRHFCFSCRILGMGVETWLYRHLGRPGIKIVGEVLTDLLHDTRDIDWIELKTGASDPEVKHSARAFDYVYVRGGRDLLAVSHYLAGLAPRVLGDYNALHRNVHFRLDHTVFARYAIEGINNEGLEGLRLLGYSSQLLEASVTDLPEGRGLWLLSFIADLDNALYRHRGSGIVAPLSLPGVRTNLRNLIALPDERSGANPSFLRMLRQNFEFVGAIDEPSFAANFKILLSRAKADSLIYILLPNDYVILQNGTNRLLKKPLEVGFAPVSETVLASLRPIPSCFPHPQGRRTGLEVFSGQTHPVGISFGSRTKL